MVSSAGAELLGEDPVGASEDVSLGAEPVETPVVSSAGAELLGEDPVGASEDVSLGPELEPEFGPKLETGLEAETGPELEAESLGVELLCALVGILEESSVELIELESVITEEFQ